MKLEKFAYNFFSKISFLTQLKDIISVISSFVKKRRFLKIKLLTVDYFILTILSYIVLVDMINGFLMMEFSKIPISQIFKFFLIILLTFRLVKTKDFAFIILLLIVFQIGPFLGLLKNGSIKDFFSDAVVATKWFNVPLSFFYFKTLFQGHSFPLLEIKIKQVVSRSFKLITLNMFLGFLGLGMAFYNHGYGNAVGTRGYIFAGNELTILVLTLGFMIAMYFYQQGMYKKYIFLFLLFLIFSFLITSKTVLGGVALVFVIPVISSIKINAKLNQKWINRIFITIVFGLPFLISIFYFGIINSGILNKLKYSLKRNDNDILTVVLSNRNNFIKKGWEVFVNDYSIIGKLFGYGQNHHVTISGHLAEVDFFSLLFASGFFGLLTLIFVISYWLLNALKLKQNPSHIYAKPVLIYLWFLIIIANLSGHIFGSGIAGYFIGLSIAAMFYYNPNRKSNEKLI